MGWIPRMTGQAPALRSQQLILTIYGLYAREEGSSLPVAGLVHLLGDLGVDAPGVRSSVSRLKHREILQSTREHGNAAYSISPDGMQLFIDGDARIYAPVRARAEDPWLLAVFSVPEDHRNKRHLLRTALTRLGFGSVTSGVWIAPITVREQTEHQISRLHLDEYVRFFSADSLSLESGAALVAEWWDVDSLSALYLDFIDRYAPLREKWAERVGIDADPSAARDAFVDYVPMFTQWRRLPYLDPGLPLEFLPKNWSGQVAEQLVAELAELIGPLAREHARSIIRR